MPTSCTDWQDPCQVEITLEKRTVMTYRREFLFLKWNALAFITVTQFIYLLVE